MKENSIDACTRIINDPKDAKNHAAAYNNRGIYYSAKQQLDQAIADFIAAIRLNPKDPDTYYNLGTVYTDKGKNLLNAIAAFEKALALGFDPAKTHFNMGIAYQNAMVLPYAIEEFGKAIAAQPNYAKAYKARAALYSWTLSGVKDYPKAIADYTILIRLNPEDVEAYYGRARSYRYSNDPENALADYNQVLRLQPLHKDTLKESAFLYFDKASKAQKAGDLSAAVTNYSEAIRRNRDENHLFARGNAYFDMEDFERAEADYQSSLDLTKGAAITDWLKQDRIIICQHLQKKFDIVIDYYTKRIAEDPKKTQFYGPLGLAYLSTGEVSKAVETFTAMKSINQNDTSFNMYMAFVFLAKNQIEDAMNALNAAVGAEGNLIPLLLRAELLEKSGKPLEAKKDRERVRALDKNHELPSDAVMRRTLKNQMLFPI